jgi:hypothetical protein
MLQTARGSGDTVTLSACHRLGVSICEEQQLARHECNAVVTWTFLNKQPEPSHYGEKTDNFLQVKIIIH